MAMFRRSRKPAPPLHRKQQEIAQQEAQLREQVESLERISHNRGGPRRTNLQRENRTAAQSTMLSRSDFMCRLQWRSRRSLTQTKGAGVLVHCAKSDGTGRSSFSFF